MKSIHITNQLVAIVAAICVFASQAHAQRPSLGGLQQQIDGMLGGDLDFTEVSFGEDCGICVDPTLPGLIEKDPFGFRILGQNQQGCILRFGPTDNCSIGVDVEREALVFSDINCFLFENPFGKQPVIKLPNGLMRFGENCTLGIDPNFSGLTESDPNGFRLLGLNQEGCILRFGPTDNCSIGVDPTREGLIFSDVGCFIFENPLGDQPEVQIPGGFLRFGDECTIGIDPQFTGLVERDPGGLRLLGQDGVGCILTFGPTDECRILVNPKLQENGLTFQDPRRVLFENPNGGPGSANVAVDGVIAAVEFVQVSRGDLKENVRQIDDALDVVKKLRGVYFDWKDEAKKSPTKRSGAADLGFIAEEVAEVLQEAATYDDSGTTAQGVKYSNLVALVVESVKQQQEQIESQQALIEELQDQLAEIRTQK